MSRASHHKLGLDLLCLTDHLLKLLWLLLLAVWQGHAITESPEAGQPYWLSWLSSMSLFTRASRRAYPTSLCHPICLGLRAAG